MLQFSTYQLAFTVSGSKLHREILSARKGVGEDSCLLVCFLSFSEWFPTFQKILQPFWTVYTLK